MSDIKYAIYGSTAQEGGVYNVLASFLRGLYKGFKEAGLNIYDFDDCLKKNIDYDVAIGFNLAGVNHWADVIGANKINVIWTVDSIFSLNAKVFERCQNIQNTLTLSVTNADNAAKEYYLSGLKYAYMPHATDKDLWKKKEDCKKEHDIVLFSSLYDFEGKLEKIKNNKLLYSFVNEFVEMLEKQPNMSFWEAYLLAKDAGNFELDYENYTGLYELVTSISEQKQKIKLIKSLSDLNVKVWGNELWKKYISGNVQYMGKANMLETIDIMNRAKINLHCHPVKLNYGLHERFLNASSLGTFNLVSDTPSVKNEFKDSFGYFNHSTFEDIDEKAAYYLNNEDEREQKALEAMKIVHKKHLWKNRAKAIDKLFV